MLERKRSMFHDWCFAKRRGEGEIVLINECLMHLVRLLQVALPGYCLVGCSEISCLLTRDCER